MIELKLSEAAIAMDGVLHGDDLRFCSVTTDSRVTEGNELFIALKGEKFDAWDFVESAVKNGIKAAVLTREPKVNIPWIEVKDTRIALGKLGSYVKQKVNPITIGITGTCGKTSVKDMTLSIMSLMGKTLATNGNFNNDIGVPLTLLRLDESIKYAVVEMGTNHPGELSYSTSLVGEDVCLINNVGFAHLEGFKSLHGVFDAKYEIFEGLKKGSSAIFSSESEFIEEFKNKATSDGFKAKSFGFDKNSDTYASDIKTLSDGTSEFYLNNPDGKILIKLNIVGRHNVLNACAAASIAFSLGTPLSFIKQGLENYRPFEGRLKVETHGDITLIDDTYNASANAVFAAIDTLQGLQGKKILILGDMGELGSMAEELHREVGRKVNNSSVDLLVALGELTRFCVEEAKDKAVFFSVRDELYAQLPKYIEKNQKVTVLVKGSHGMKMGEVLNYIREHLC